jgi:hypothetical protein
VDVVIKVWRGMVTSVYSSESNVKVVVVDEDEMTDEEISKIKLPEHQVY